MLVDGSDCAAVMDSSIRCCSVLETHIVAHYYYYYYYYIPKHSFIKLYKAMCEPNHMQKLKERCRENVKGSYLKKTVGVISFCSPA